MGKDLFLAAFRGEATECPPAWEQAFSSDVAGEILGREAYLGAMLLSWVNTWFYQELMAAMRRHIEAGTFDDFRREWAGRLSASEPHH